MKRLTHKKRAEIWELFQQGFTVKQISEALKIPYSTTYLYSRGRKRGFNSATEYGNYLVRKKNYLSLKEYNASLLKKKGYNSLRAYHEDLFKKKGYQSVKEYQQNFLKDRGYESIKEYEESLAKEKGYKSRIHYKRALAKKRQQKPENRGLSNLIRKRLMEIGENQSWLAKEIGVTRQAVSLYSQGKIIPNKKVLMELYCTLDVQYKTLEYYLRK